MIHRITNGPKFSTGYQPMELFCDILPIYSIYDVLH